MRVIENYFFALPNAPIWDQIPEKVDAFLHAQGLSHKFFHYCFTSLDYSQRHRAILDGSACKKCGAPPFICESCRNDAAKALRKNTGCRKLAEDFPFLGQVELKTEGPFSTQCLHNFSDDSNGAKESIYALLPSLSRRYKLKDTCIVYRDIDFCGQRYPCAVPDIESLTNGCIGSGITVLHTHDGGNCAVMTIEHRYPGQLQNTKPYANAFAQHLGCENHLYYRTRIIMDDGETTHYDHLRSLAKPLIEQTANFINQHFPEQDESTDSTKPIKLASHLKKLAQKYGYDYLGYHYYVYALEKKVPNGHKIRLELVCEPRSHQIDPHIVLSGLGFEHNIPSNSFTPQNSQQSLSIFFEVLRQAEQTMVPSIFDLYPPTPDWFVKLF